MFPKRLLTLLFLTAFTTSLLAHGDHSTAVSPIRIGVSSAFKGTSKSLGIELFRGAKPVIDEINNNGGIDGHRVEIVALDDGYSPLPALQNTIFLLDKADVLLLFNYVGTPTVTRVLPVLKSYESKNSYLFFPFTGAQPQREYPYDKFVYNLRASYKDETAGLVDHFIKIGRTKIAVFYQIDAYGRSGWEGVKNQLKNYGLPIQCEATYYRGTKKDANFEAQVNVLKEEEPDAIISIGSYEASAAFIRDVRRSGWDIPIANVSFVGSEKMLQVLSEFEKEYNMSFTENLINSQVVPSYEDTSLPAVRAYRKAMEQQIDYPFQREEEYSPLKYSFVSFEGYLNAKLLVYILSQLAPEFNKADIPKVMSKINHYDLGIDVPVSFSQGNQGLKKVYFTTVKDNKFIPLKTWEQWAK